MSGSLAVDAPLSLLDALWVSGDDEHAHFASLLDSALHVPCLNALAEPIKHESLCSYRGIVQHTLGAEMYIGAYAERDELGRSTLKSSKYKEEIRPSRPECVLDMDSLAHGQGLMRERLPVVLGTVPGLSMWASSQSLEQGSPHDPCAPSSAKRLAMDDGSGIPRVGSSLQFTDTVPQCLVKLYDMDWDELRLNDVLEVVGVYYSPLSSEQMYVDEQERDFESDGFMQDASSLFCGIPTLHCVAMRRLGSAFPIIRAPPFLHPFLSTTPLALPATMNSQRVSAIRASLKRRLVRCLRGDELAAEYTLLACLSKVYGTRPEACPLGVLSLGLAGVPKSTAGDSLVNELLNVLSSVLPRLVAMDAVTDATAMVPHFNADSGLFSVSSLHMAAGTMLCVDERGVRPGEPVPQAVREAAPYLSSVVERLSLPLRSEFCAVYLPMDVSVLVISDSSSLFAPVVRCTWTPNAQVSSQGGDEELSLDSDMRLWWAFTRQLSVVMAAQTVLLAENDFVNARQIDSRLTAEDFHIWLSVARMIAVSYGMSIL